MKFLKRRLIKEDNKQQTSEATALTDISQQFSVAQATPIIPIIDSPLSHETSPTIPSETSKDTFLHSQPISNDIASTLASDVFLTPVSQIVKKNTSLQMALPLARTSHNFPSIGNNSRSMVSRSESPPLSPRDSITVSRKQITFSSSSSSSNSLDPVVSNISAPTQTVGSILENNKYDDPFAKLPLLSATEESEKQNLVCKKLQLCCQILDLNQPEHVRYTVSRRQTVLELLEYINNMQTGFTEVMIENIMRMVASNIFRTLAPSPLQTVTLLNIGFEPEEEEPTLENNWPYLQIVYEFFLRFLFSTDLDPKVVKKYIDQEFILNLLELFSSEDPRERDYLKTILHRIYGKILALRSFIRRAIQHIFYAYIYECERHKGIAELLEILGSIINGFALPLKEEHKIFLETALIPLHKTKDIMAFHQQLTYCMTQYVEKDSQLAEIIIAGLLKYWPITNTNKEVSFLNELEEILDLIQPSEFQNIMIPLFRQLAICIQSPHFQVAERVLFFWNNEYIVNLFNSNKEQLFPIIIAALYKNSKEHWNRTVHGLTYNVSKLLSEVDPELFEDCSDRNLSKEEMRNQKQREKDLKWKELESQYYQAKI